MMGVETANPLVAEAIDFLDGDSAVAKLAGITPWAVSKWRKNLPADRVLWLSEKTGWKYTPNQLAPHLYPNTTDGLPVKKGSSYGRRKDDHPPP